jgi:kinesin family member 11
MQGDLAATPLGNPSAEAGMIPRVLFQLFRQLERGAADYSVRVSYVELYNEELRDLLSPESENPEQLKIFDDAHKKGVFIQGLEEVGVSNAKEALAVLTRGSDRRAIAATKFNEHSSRSHAVFTLTVHTKETAGTAGDDLLRVGKMNLVDLAGSENIGRSGAKEGRAREAGMINQSLLTLGRVINALVDHASHVPYRESKLTRLLQDSLGGRTKTCIVATVSPARNNVEETLSTLDYALRAKSIANRPELNARMTRNALLKDYVAEIERLKADVLAARERNGIFLSEERWDAMERERETSASQREEARAQVERAESALRNVREEFEQSLEVLTRRDRELGEAKEKLVQREGELADRVQELKRTENALEEETVVRRAHEQAENVLNGVAADLKRVATESVSDIGGLFDKLGAHLIRFLFAT